MASKSISGVRQSSDLERQLGSTIMDQYFSRIDSYLLDGLRKQGENIYIPSVQLLIDEIPELKAKLIDLYNRTMGLEEGVQHIPDDLKALQGALLDGLVFGYDFMDETFSLYTMNFGLLTGEDDFTTKDYASEVMKKNIMGVCKGYRVDIKYQESEDSFSYKCVNQRSKELDDERVVLVPYVSVVRVMKMISAYLGSGSVLMVRQDVEGVDKIRFITTNINALMRKTAHLSKDIAARARYFPLAGFFYAPVVGASVLTSMVTNINVFRLNELRKAPSDTQKLEAVYRKFGVTASKDPVDELLVHMAIVKAFMIVKSTKSESMSGLVAKLPRVDTILFGVENVEDISEAIISKYINSLSEKETQQVCDLLFDYCDIEGIYSNLKKAFGSNKVQALTQLDLQPENLKNILKKYVCKFTIQKSDCRLSSVIGTNSTELLECVYGEGYFNKYESLGSRYWKAISVASDTGTDLLDVLLKYDIDVKDIPEVQSEYSKKLENPDFLNNDAMLRDFYKTVCKGLGKQYRSPSSSDSEIVMLRTVDSYLDAEGKPVDYYKYIDPKHVVSGYIIG